MHKFLYIRRKVGSLKPVAGSSDRGMTLVEVLFTVGIIILVFAAIFGVFKISVEVVSGSKARVGALSLAVERMEQIRSMSYNSVGTVGGIPAGLVPQEETLTLNQTSYTRRTFISYVDEAADGTGVADENGITADYKRVKVEMSWTIRGVERTYSVVSNIIPPGIESLSGGGTLRIQVFDALAQPVSSAEVHVTNTSASPAVDVTTYTNSSGVVVFPGTPAGVGYHVEVGKPGYSNAQTYTSSVSNPNPTPGDLSVVNAKTTTASFAIDRVSSLLVRTLKPIELVSWTDSFDDSTLVDVQASTTVSGGSLALNSGDLLGNARATSTTPSYLSAWQSATWVASTPGASTAKVRVYSEQNGVYTLLPEAVLLGNAAGFASSPINLSLVSTSTYPSLALGVSFTSDGSDIPALTSWNINYLKGPTPIPNITFTMQGLKTIGTNASGAAIYKYVRTNDTQSDGRYSTSTLEWDSYGLSIASAEGYDISESCGPLPLSVSPNTTLSLDLYLVPHTTNSMRVVVKDSTTGAVIPGVSVHSTKTGFDNTKSTSSCGQVFWDGIDSGSYNLNVSKSGYQTQTSVSAVVSGTTVITISMTPQ